MKAIFINPPLPDPPYVWLLSIGPVKVGIKEKNGWYMLFNEETICLDAEYKFMPLLPLLENRPEEFKDFLEKILSHSPYQINQFPEKLLLEYAFKNSFSEYWPKKALEWLKKNKEIQPLFADELKKIFKNKVFSQKTRQQARAIMSTASGGYNKAC
ncbi:hypothetical protein [Serratia fonticola]|uniref:hypothetical protein n=1 Tax=Serratia fonticola TaxID=47917 RepID=UPI0021BDC5F8|nr:hypothetical protein [Serratia fonticola]